MELTRGQARKEPTVMRMKKRVADQGTGCCSVVAVVSIDERGQMVLPKELRDRAGIKAGDKLALVAMEKGAEVCCISLLKAEALSGLVQDVLKPVMKEVF
jgi:antitoxin PrlF